MLIIRKDGKEFTTDWSYLAEDGEPDDYSIKVTIGKERFWLDNEERIRVAMALLIGYDRDAIRQFLDVGKFG